MDKYGDDTGLVPAMGLAEKLGVSPLAIFRLAHAGKVQLYRNERRHCDLMWQLVDEKQAVNALAKEGGRTNE